MKMSVQELIAPYLNRFVILFNQIATAKLEFSCAEGKVNVNIFHELEAIRQPLPTTPLVKKAGYNEVLKKNLKASQLKRLQRRAAAHAEEAKAEEAKTPKEKDSNEQALEDAVKAKHVSEQQNISAAEANIEVHGANAKSEEGMAIAEAEKAIFEDLTKAEKEQIELDKAQSKDMFRCTFCRDLFYSKCGFTDHTFSGWVHREERKCPLCDLCFSNCHYVKEHMKEKHKRDFVFTAGEYFK
jgi:hypothetical protein